MSGDFTQGRIEAFTEPEFSGWWALREKTDDGINHEVGSGDGGFFEPDARRLAACWNFCERLATKDIENRNAAHAIGAALTAGDAINAELAAARALLHEVMGIPFDLGGCGDRIRSYLDSCDKQGGA